MPPEHALATVGSPGPEQARRDEHLQPREDRLATATDQWPRPLRPSIYHDRFIRVSNPRSNGFIFHESHIESHRSYGSFESHRRQYSDHYGWR